VSLIFAVSGPAFLPEGASDFFRPAGEGNFSGARDATPTAVESLPPAMSAAFRNVARGPRRPTPQERMMLCRRALLVLCRRCIMLAFFRAGGPTTSHKSGVVMHSLMLPCRSGPYRGRLVPEKKVWAVSVSLNFQTHE